MLFVYKLIFFLSGLCSAMSLPIVYSDLLKVYPRKPEDETFIVCFRRKPSYVKSPILVISLGLEFKY